jgi:hypothetical protein
MGLEGYSIESHMLRLVILEFLSDPTVRRFVTHVVPYCGHQLGS